MIAARKSVMLIGAIAVVFLTASACSGQEPASVETSSAVASAPSTEAPTQTAGAPDSTPEETAAPTPTVPVRPKPGSGNVDPALFVVDLELSTTGDTNQLSFGTPTGNIKCSIWPRSSIYGDVGCQARTSVNPESGQTCTNAENDKFAVRVNDGGSQHICTTQGIYVTRGARVLEYGQVLSVNDVTCSSDAATGVTCWAREGGFTFSRDINLIF